MDKAFGKSATLACRQVHPELIHGTRPRNALLLTRIFHKFTQLIGFTGKFMKESRIDDYGRLNKYFLCNQEASEMVHNL